MRHLDLFSGIGGFALAVDSVFPNAEHVFCEIDPFCQQVLKKNFPNSKIHGDIREFTDADAGFDILTGGFPCQPFSQAGKRKGTADDRWLWCDLLRIIQTAKPTFCILENVRGILTIEQGMVFEQVCLDLEASGYEVQTFIIPAVAVNAPHRRDRVWFVAHYTSKRPDNRERDREERHLLHNIYRASEEGESERGGWECGAGEIDTDAPDSEGRESGITTERKRRENPERRSWDKNWIEVATEFCQLDDGLPVELGEFKLSKAKHRAEQLKAYGNSIVPQLAIEIMKAIKTNLTTQ